MGFKEAMKRAGMGAVATGTALASAVSPLGNSAVPSATGVNNVNAPTAIHATAPKSTSWQQRLAKSGYTSNISNLQKGVQTLTNARENRSKMGRFHGAHMATRTTTAKVDVPTPSKAVNAAQPKRSPGQAIRSSQKKSDVTVQGTPVKAVNTAQAKRSPNHIIRSSQKKSGITANGVKIVQTGSVPGQNKGIAAAKQKMAATKKTQTPATKTRQTVKQGPRRNAIRQSSRPAVSKFGGVKRGGSIKGGGKSSGGKSSGGGGKSR